MTATAGTPSRAVAHYRWAITLQTPGHDPVEFKGTQTSIATPEEDERAIRFVTERSFHKAHPDQDGPVTVLSFSLEPDERRPGCSCSYCSPAQEAS
jgi:hypothetical protein